MYVSTFDTDYVLIEERNLVDAVASLRQQNFAFMLEGEQVRLLFSPYCELYTQFPEMNVNPYRSLMRTRQTKSKCTSPRVRLRPSRSGYAA